MNQTVIVHKSGSNLLVRFVWWLLIGWWASGIVVAIAWFALATIIGIPVGIWLINRLPSILTLRPRTRVWTMGQGAEGRTVIHEGGSATDRLADSRSLVRAHRLVGVGDLDGACLAHPAHDHRPAARPPHVQSDAVCRVALPLLRTRTGPAHAHCEGQASTMSGS